MSQQRQTRAHAGAPLGREAQKQELSVLRPSVEAEDESGDGDTTSSISSTQRVKLMTLWHQYSRRSLDVAGSDREERLQWARGVLNREVRSFNDLSAREASRVISALNQSLGLPAHKPRQRDRAQAAGTHGRRGDDRRSAEIAGAEDLARVQRALDRLGWTQQRFEAWLASPSSPLGRNKQMRTVSDCNKVWWALKRFLKREGQWEE